MSQDTQSRSYQITINNPDEKGFDNNKINTIIAKSKVKFACYAREIGEQGTPHIHIYIVFPSARRFSTLLKLFPGAHIETTYGSVQDNIDYIKKEGKFANTDKAETKVEGSYREVGEIPTSESLNSSDMEEVVKLLEEGYSVIEIIKTYPKYAFKINSIDAVKQAFLAQKYREIMRAVEVTYKFGATGTGKTRSIYNDYAPEDVCRITSYRKNGVRFDSYKCEDVLVFEEYASQIPIEDFLVYLDIYPLMLPARYSDKTACYTKVIITSNLPLQAQYILEQSTKPETFAAFLRRINYVEEYATDGTVIRTMINEPVKIKKEVETND